MVTEGLSEILKQMHDPEYKNEAKEEALRVVSEMKAKQIIKKKGKGAKLSLNDLS